MFRIKASYNKETKTTRLTSDTLKKEFKSEAYQSDSFQFKRKCQELIRDRLYKIYRNKYRKYEQIKMIRKSICSAAKRMKTLEPTRELAQ